MTSGLYQALNQKLQPRNANEARTLAAGSASSPTASSTTLQAQDLAALSIQCRNYFTQHDAIFREMDRLKSQGWTLPQGDEHFQKQRANADRQTHQSEKVFFNMHLVIGKELREAGAFIMEDPDRSEIKALNICMAPGAYTRAILEQYPGAAISGISLPINMGGHKMMIRHGAADSRVNVRFADITMFVEEFSAHGTNIPSDHPDAFNFRKWSPFAGHLFDLVVCDGQALRTHHREGMKANLEPIRLLVSQLIFGMSRIRSGGTFVMLVHKVHSYDSVLLLKDFCSFAGNVQLFKPSSAHQFRSTCYMIAKDVQPSKEEARACIDKWKGQWVTTTIGGGDQAGTQPETPTSAEVETLLADFGPTIIAMSQESWNVQVIALREWIRRMSRSPGKRSGAPRGDNEPSRPLGPEAIPLSLSFNENPVNASSSFSEAHQSQSHILESISETKTSPSRDHSFQLGDKELGEIAGTDRKSDIR
ncbi:MAG: hypothetical protein L6R35_005852 [Caloplaca aegaea]|nr:MAG: hypothetical protein L6R35_005852 [Caloplaca aegaea]